MDRRHYETPDFADFGACCAFGTARNHPFVDGDKRTAFAAMMMFLRLNGLPVAPDPALATAGMLAPARSAKRA